MVIVGVSLSNNTKFRTFRAVLTFLASPRCLNKQSLARVQFPSRSPECRSAWAPSDAPWRKANAPSPPSKHPKHAHATRKAPHHERLQTLALLNCKRQVCMCSSFGAPGLPSVQPSSRTHCALACPSLSPRVFGSTTEVAPRLVGISSYCLEADIAYACHHRTADTRWSDICPSI